MASKDLAIGQAIEMIRLKVASENLNKFLEGRKEVDGFVSQLNGYVGTEIVKVNANEYLMLIRWKSEAAVKEAQKITETASIISNWIKETSEFVSFETTVSVYEH